jgi:saccharopine dehydrogenase-like NADP-dependent oxidoreductase
MTSKGVGGTSIQRVAVLGLGNVGALVADMLAEQGFDVLAADADPSRVAYDGAIAVDVNDPAALDDLVGRVDAVVSCLPFRLNAEVARTAHSHGAHYLDLTEDVPTSEVVQGLAAEAASSFIPHCGLAPGFICLVGASMAGRLDEVESIALRVGALPRTPNNALGYAFNWSPAGVVNEYLNPCEVLQHGKRTTVPPLSELETILIDGTPYEAFTTSGGLGTMCESYAGRVDRLDYKTMRYPGHCDLMRFFLGELRLGADRGRAEEILTAAYPPVQEDLVVLYAAAEGMRDGRRAREEFVRVYRPRVVAGRVRTAIAWTTAAGVVGVLELLCEGQLPREGFVRQEDVPLDDFLRTRAGRLLAGEPADQAPAGQVAEPTVSLGV